MAVLQKNKFTPVAIGILLVVLVTLIFSPILPDSTSPCGTHTSYASLLRDVWNKKILKKQDTKSAEQSTECKK